MNLMRLADGISRCFSAAGACLLATALLAGSVCGPACSGGLCPAKSTAREAKIGCHGMAARASDSPSVMALPQVCNLAAASLATLAKPVIAVSDTVRVSHSARTLNVANDLQISLHATRSSLLRSKDSPPIFSASFTSTIVLRV